MGGFRPSQAYVAKEFEVMPTFFQGRDSRVNGEGADFAFNLRLVPRFSMGYRFEYLTIHANDALVAAPLTPAMGAFHAVVHGFTGFYRVYEPGPSGLGMDFGLSAGAFSLMQVGTPFMSPFIEPMAVALYRPSAKESGALIKVALGYRLIHASPVLPLFLVGGVPTRIITDWDGLDIQLGVGFSF